MRHLGPSLRELSARTGIGTRLLGRIRSGAALGELPERRRLAEALGVTLATVTRWKRKGVPARRLERVAELVADRSAAKQGIEAERKKVRELLSKARKKGLIPKTQAKGSRPFSGRKAYGLKTVTHIDAYLDDDTLLLIQDAVLDAPKGHYYIVTVTAVEAGTTGKVRGYGGTLTQKLGKAAENISFETAITSGKWTSKRKALEALFDKLQDGIEDAEALIFIIDTLVFSYQYREEL